MARAVSAVSDVEVVARSQRQPIGGINPVTVYFIVVGEGFSVRNSTGTLFGCNFAMIHLAPCSQI